MFVDLVEGTKRGSVVRVHVAPRARQDAVIGADTRGLLVRVRASPEHGKANDAVVRTVASWLGVARSMVELVAGGSGRDKRLRVDMDLARLRELIGDRLTRSARADPP